MPLKEILSTNIVLSELALNVSTIIIRIKLVALNYFSIVEHKCNMHMLGMFLLFYMKHPTDMCSGQPL